MDADDLRLLIIYLSALRLLYRDWLSVEESPPLNAYPATPAEILLRYGPRVPCSVP